VEDLGDLILFRSRVPVKPSAILYRQAASNSFTNIVVYDIDESLV